MVDCPAKLDPARVPVPGKAFGEPSKEEVCTVLPVVTHPGGPFRSDSYY